MAAPRPAEEAVMRATFSLLWSVAPAIVVVDVDDDAIVLLVVESPWKQLILLLQWELLNLPVSCDQSPSSLHVM